MSQTTVRKKESWFPENVSHYLLQYKHSNGLAFGNQTQQLKINHLDHLVRCFFQSKHLRILFGDYVQLRDVWVPGSNLYQSSMCNGFRSYPK